MSRGCWQFSLTAEALALDACIALELILMITNTQTLGVPIRFAAIGGSFSALCGFLLIPILGVFTDRWAKSKSSRATIVILTACLEFTGALCVFTANALKLFWEERRNEDHLHQNILQGPSSLAIDEMRLTANATKGYLDLPNDTSINFTAESPTSNAMWNHSVTNWYIRLHQNSTDYLGFGTALHSNLTFPGPDIPTHTVPFYAYIAIFGYCCLDAGYDFGGCFLKTFILHCTPSDQHVSVLMNLILVASVGGVITSVLGSFDVGTLLIADTDYDSNAALAMIVSAVCGTLVVLGTGVTLLTGFCWRPPDQTTSHKLNGERAVLIPSSDTRTHSSDYSNGTLLTTEPTNGSITTEKEHLYQTNGTSQVRTRSRGISSFFQRHKKQIQVNVMAFGSMGAVTCFGVFGTNFVGTGIFGGDPAAPSDSKEYQRFLDGVTVGSRGTLLYFVVFAIFSIFHQKSLELFGWKKETILVTLSYFILCVALALSKNVYMFYVTSVATGFTRTVAMTVPYILAHKIAAEKDGGKSSSTAISFIAASLPCGVFICTLVMGPLIEVTGNPGVSILYAGVCSALACVFASVLDI